MLRQAPAARAAHCSHPERPPDGTPGCDGARPQLSHADTTLLMWPAWLASQISLDSGFAPATLLAAQAAIAPPRAGQARLFVLKLNSPTTRPTPVPDSAAPLYARSAWSRRGSWLLYQGPGQRLRAFRLPGQAVALNAPCCEYAALVTAPSSPSSPRHGLRRSTAPPGHVTDDASARAHPQAHTRTVSVAAGVTVKRFGLAESAGTVRLLRVVARLGTRLTITATIPHTATVSIAAPRPRRDPSESCRQRGRFEVCTQAVEACPMPSATWRVSLHKLAGPAGQVRLEFIVG